MTRNYDIIIIGGGAAGFFAAINVAEKNPKIKIAILERGKDVLEKVRISGGGRCNVTHACYDPRELVKFYPRGEKELRGPFHTFSAGDTVEWFARHGVELKTESDGRMFPVTDSSQTIIDCLVGSARNLKIDVLTGQSVQSVFKSGEFWKIDTQNSNFACADLVMATGSNPKMWELLRQVGHTIIEPVPSLFTFNIKDERIKNLMGVAAPASVKINGTKLEASGPLLITHWGMSGPAILRLSAWGARILSDKKYKFSISVNWLKDDTTEDAGNLVRELKGQHSKKLLPGKSPVELPNRLWESIVTAAKIESGTRWADLNKQQLHALASELSNAQFPVDGKSTFKEEFVTAGGIELREVNLKTMQSKLHDHLYFAGEILNIDAITGGFNFQNAWTGGFIVAQSIG